MRLITEYKQSSLSLPTATTNAHPHPAPPPAGWILGTGGQVDWRKPLSWDSNPHYWSGSSVGQALSWRVRSEDEAGWTATERLWGWGLGDWVSSHCILMEGNEHLYVALCCFFKEGIEWEKNTFTWPCWIRRDCSWHNMCHEYKTLLCAPPYVNLRNGHIKMGRIWTKLYCDDSVGKSRIINYRSPVDAEQGTIYPKQGIPASSLNIRLYLD